MKMKYIFLLIWLIFESLLSISYSQFVSYKLPEEAGVIDVTKYPYNADNTGQNDCTEALQKAFTHAVKKTKGIYTDMDRALQILYFPNGRYRVSRPLIFVSDEIKKIRNQNSIALKKYISGHMMIYGESKENTKIILNNNVEEFQREQTPLIRFLESDFTNSEYFNSIRNITIEIGKNNPKAVAVEFVSNNIGSIDNVNIVNRDEKNPAEIGLNLPIKGGGLSYIKNLNIYGFKTGIYIKGDFPGYTFENIYLENQKVVGIKNIDKNIVIRNLHSTNKVPVLIAEDEAAITTIIDGQFTDGNKNNVAIDNNGHILLRNIKFNGYGRFLKGIDIKYKDKTIEEYASNTLSLFENAPKTTLNLPIKNTPNYNFPKPDEWRIFDVTVQDDDTKALQAIIDSGVEYIFVKGVTEKLKISNTIYLRGNLKILHGGWTNMNVENNGAIGDPLFCFQDGENELMILEGFSNGQRRNTFTTFLNNRSKTLVIRDMFMGYGHSSYRNTGKGDLFLENVVTGGGDYPERAEHKIAGWKFENQNVWFRNLNPEEWIPDIHIGKDANVFGLGAKFGELYGTHILVSEGGKGEMYGVMCNVNLNAPNKYGLDIHKPSMSGITIEVENGDLSLGVFQDGTHANPDPIFIKEIQGKNTVILKHKDAPIRRKGEESVCTPLYRSKVK
jgi:hypothetical protein